MVKRESNSDALQIKLEVIPGPGYEGDGRGLDLVRRAIVELIEQFDTHLLEKEEGFEETPQFYASILAAVARHYMVDMPVEAEMTVQQVVLEMVDNLASAGLLQETITSRSEDSE